MGSRVPSAKGGTEGDGNTAACCYIKVKKEESSCVCISMPSAQDPDYLSCKPLAASTRGSSSSHTSYLAHPQPLLAFATYPLPPLMSNARSFDSFRSFHADLAAASCEDGSFHGELASSSSSSSSAIQIAGRHHRDREQEAHDRAYLRHQSAPVDVVTPCQWRSYREERRRQGSNAHERGRGFKEASREEVEEGKEDEEEEEEDGEEEEERLPPHEELERQRAAATRGGGAAFSLCQGVGRTLKGRDLCRVRNAILKRTGFIS